MQTSKTEYNVAEMLSKGLQVKEIANKMFRSPYTVDTHIKNIKKKNGLKNIADIVREFILDLDNPKSFFKLSVVALFLTIQGFISIQNPEIDLKKPIVKRVTRIARRGFESLT